MNDRSEEEKETSFAVQFLSSHKLTVIVVSTTVIFLSLLLIDDRSDGLRVLFTFVVGLQFLTTAWLFVTFLLVLYDTDAWNDDQFDFLGILDYYVMYVLVWSNTGLLFWLWDGDDLRDGSFTGIENLQPFSAWLVFFYITVFIMSGVAYGRYVAFSLLAEAWAALLAAISLIMVGMVMSSVIIRILDRTHLRRTALEVSGASSSQRPKYS